MNPPSPSLRLRLDFYPAAVILSRWAEDGRVLSYPVSAHDLAGACAAVELGSGLLPANTLFWRQQADQAALGIYVPARRWRVQTAERRYRLPLPPLLFAGWGTSYRVFALKERPQPGVGPAVPLYRAPCPNVHASGGICQGNTPFPTCAAGTIETALRLFLEESYFNGDLSGGKCQSHPNDVLRLWAELDGRKRFPLSELIQASMTLGQLL